MCFRPCLPIRSSVARLSGFTPNWVVLNLIVRVKKLAWAGGQNLGGFKTSLAVLKNVHSRLN